MAKRRAPRQSCGSARESDRSMSRTGSSMRTAGCDQAKRERKIGLRGKRRMEVWSSARR
jgi:hypothetical protein